MKFDVARAWKDENYRQGLTEEQLQALPANPAGELSEVELASVQGGGDGGWGGWGVPAGIFGASSSSASSAHTTRVHSFAVLCDVSVFSVNLLPILVIPIASPTTQVCAEEH